MHTSDTVTALLETREIPTYAAGEPERNPVFFERRVYQGSNGKVYPVPFIDKVADVASPVRYRTARIENGLVRIVLLPEIGGRIFIGQDKTNRDYDFFYRQDVIKPALVGLAGPWISGGVEFNWPQHHRPGTFLPCDTWIEEEADGARTVWQSEHDPIHRMKGMHGIRLRPGSSVVELRARLCNRTPLTRTFLWWANVAARVHDRYQSFFPPDVHYVADHAVRALSSFPVALNSYYGVDYAARPGANDLTWYRNIPVPTSYMVCQTAFDFFGGYDHGAGGGFVHVADRDIAPGKKQWTWGNHPFGHAWDRELTDANGPYVELMAGVYTDNQPDFSYLLPYETKTFSQFWWPIRGIGPVQMANRRAALRMVVQGDRTLDLGLNVSEAVAGGRLEIREAGSLLLEAEFSLQPGEVWRNASVRMAGEREDALEARLIDANGRCLLAYRPVDRGALRRERSQAVEPPAPKDVPSADELYFIGEHLEQYRHPTRSPELYWNEALRRDAGDARCNLAIGKRRLDRGLCAEAEAFLRRAVGRLTSHHPNPVTGEAHYMLALCVERLGREREARALYAKAAWSFDWRAAAHFRIACIDSRGGNLESALEHAEASLETNSDLNQARCLRALMQRKLGSTGFRAGLEDVLEKDPLDHLARALLAHGEGDWDGFLQVCRNDAQTVLDIAFDLVEAGAPQIASALIERHHLGPDVPCAVPNPAARTPMTHYVLAWLNRDSVLLARARAQSPDRFFPSRWQEQDVLKWALAQPGADPVAAYALGNLLHDQGRHAEAIDCWLRATAEAPGHAQSHRNLGIALWNLKRDRSGARQCFLRAMESDPGDARLLSEHDQLCEKLNESPSVRLALLESRRELALQRDDSSVALATLLNLEGREDEALELLRSRRFHPWEGGEGRVLRQFTTARLLRGQRLLAAGDASAALEEFDSALATPPNLGEAYHLHQAKADVNYWRGRALRALGREREAVAAFEECVRERGDFADMAVTGHSTLSLPRGLALRELGRESEAAAHFRDLMEFGTRALGRVASIDYFATSLPDLLVFDDDLQARRNAEAHLLIALAQHALGDHPAASATLEKVLAFNQAMPDAVALKRSLARTS